MVSYQERKERTKYYVLIKSGTVIGLFGNLKKLQEVAFELDSSFPSYSSLSKKKKLGRIDFGDYSIQIVGLS